MIPHPPAETLIAKHGNTAVGRRAARAELRAYMLAAAEREIELAGITEGCRKRTVYYGARHEPCGNPRAESCLCPCHDPKDTP